MKKIAKQVAVILVTLGSFITTTSGFAEVNQKPVIQPQTQPPIVGAKWINISSPAEVKPDFRIRPNGSIAGFAGCNNFFGKVSNISEHTLNFGALATTRKSCSPFLNGVERNFLDTLSGTAHYLVIGDFLILNQLIFQKLKLYNLG